MVCATAVTGPCSKPSDAVGAYKTYNAGIPDVVLVIITGGLTSFEVAWVPTGSYTVVMYYRKRATPGSDYPRLTAADVAGTISSALTLAPDAIYDVWLRYETSTEYGDWTKAEALIDPGWTSLADLVIMGIEDVEFGTDTVYHG